jgi:hypothetical protein
MFVFFVITHLKQNQPWKRNWPRQKLAMEKNQPCKNTQITPKTKNKFGLHVSANF